MLRKICDICGDEISPTDVFSDGVSWNTKLLARDSVFVDARVQNRDGQQKDVCISCMIHAVELSIETIKINHEVKKRSFTLPKF